MLLIGFIALIPTVKMNGQERCIKEVTGAITPPTQMKVGQQVHLQASH